MSGSGLLAAMQRAKAAVQGAGGGMSRGRAYTPPRVLPIPELVRAPYTAPKLDFPTPPNALPQTMPSPARTPPTGGGGALVKTGGRDLASIGARGMRSIGGGATSGALAARMGAGAGAGVGAAAGELGATGLGGLLRGLAGRAGGAFLGLPGFMAGMAATPNGVGDGTMLGSDEGRAMTAEIDEYAPELEAERIGYSDPIEMSHAPEFSGVGGSGLSGFDGVGPDGSALIKGLMRTQTGRGEIFAERDSMRPPMSYADPPLNGPASALAGPKVPAGPRGSAGTGSAPLSAPTPTPDMMNALAESLKNGRPEDDLGPADPMPREQLAMPEPQFQGPGGSDTPGMEALLAGLKKKRDPMGGPVLTGGGRSVRLGGGNQFLLR